LIALPKFSKRERERWEGKGEPERDVVGVLKRER
jgi:hypothetical protein